MNMLHRFSGVFQLLREWAVEFAQHGHPVDFAGGDHTYPYVSVAELEEMTDDPAAMKARFGDNIVLVAVSAPGLYDLRANPFSTVYNGVETQANIIANIMQNRFLRQTRGEHTALIVILAGLAALIGMRRFSPSGAVVFALGLVVAYNYLCVYAFERWRLVLEMAAPKSRERTLLEAVVAWGGKEAPMVQQERLL